MPRETILVVDDEEDIRELVRYNLEREGYRVICAESGEKALAQTRSQSIDLLVLDLMLPGIDGLEVTRRLKQKQTPLNIPIVMLTAKGEEADIVTGLELGADDYISKPFSPRVLIARIKAVLRRQKTEIDRSDRIIQIHGLTIDPHRRIVEAGGQSMDLTYSEFEILVFLTRRPGWVYTRSQIVDAVRGDNYPVTDRSVDVQIVGLRKKLGAFGQIIETVRGVGYRLKEI
jgi:two-component system, OmpR family, alkaline phosphatase synthesis response regulator PhoP